MYFAIFEEKNETIEKSLNEISTHLYWESSSLPIHTLCLYNWPDCLMQRPVLADIWACFRINSLASPATDGDPSLRPSSMCFPSLAFWLLFFCLSFFCICLSHPVNNSNEHCQITPFKGSFWNVLNGAFSLCHVKSKPSNSRDILS